MQSLEKHHLLRLQRYAKAAVRHEDISVLAEDVMVALGPLFTEARLGAAMREAQDGKYDALDLDAEVEKADKVVADAKSAEEKALADAKAAQAALDAANNHAVEDIAAGVQVTKEAVDTAVAEAEVAATEDEKKTGLWGRVGGFFKGIFVKKEKV